MPDRKGIQTLEREIGKLIRGIYYNEDKQININLSSRNIEEISHHHFFVKEHIQSILYIPEIINKAIYIGEVKNEDINRNPNIINYLYFATGMKIDNNDFTCKTVVGVDANKNYYYDQSLSTIEKGKLIDIILQNGSDNLSPLITSREIGPLKDNTLPYVYYDKRLISICQVPQLKYLDENLEPTKKAIQLVKENKLYIKEENQIIQMINTDEQKNTIDTTLIQSENKDKIQEDINKINELINNIRFETKDGRIQITKTDNYILFTGYTGDRYTEFIDAIGWFNEYSRTENPSLLIKRISDDNAKLYCNNLIISSTKTNEIYKRIALKPSKDFKDVPKPSTEFTNIVNKIFDIAYNNETIMQALINQKYLNKEHLLDISQISQIT